MAEGNLDLQQERDAETGGELGSDQGVIVFRPSDAS